MLVVVIVACEVGFWVFLLSGLVVRYLCRRRRLSTVLLVTAPLVDLVLLAASVLDLRQGGTATLAHALAAVYLGCSVGFGHRMISAVDARFAHRYAGAPRPAARPRSGPRHAASERAAWTRHLVAWAVGCGLMLLAVLVIGDPSRTQSLLQTAGLWGVVLLVDGLWSFSYSLWPRRDRSGPAAEA